MDHSAEIIVVRYNQLELEKKCIDSVCKHTNLRKHKLTVVDNYQADSDLGSLWNRKIERSSKEFICLLNSDTVVEENWLDKLIETAVDRDADAVGPATNRCGVHYHLVEKVLYRKEQKVPVVSGFCLLLRRSSWERVGGFREDFPFYGSDSNLMDRLKDKFIRTDVFVHHEGRGSWEGGRRFQQEKTYAHETYVRNRDFGWSKRILLIGQPDNPVPIWSGITQGLKELRRSGLVCKYIDREHTHLCNDVLDFDPDLCLVIAAHPPSIEKWRVLLSRLSCPKGVWEGDLRNGTEREYLRGVFDRIFLCFMDSVGEYSWNEWREATGSEVSFMPCFTARTSTLLPLDIKRRCVFIGGVKNQRYHFDRQELIDALGADQFNEDIPRKRKLIEFQSGLTYRESEFCLSVSLPVSGYTSTRSFNIMSSGGLLFIRHFPEIENLLEPHEHAVVFHSRDDMVSKFQALFGSPDLERIRRAGRKLQQARHSGSWRLLNMFSNLLTGKSDFWGFAA